MNADTTMPALFIGHGNPLNALQSNAYTHAWSALAKEVPRPSAILAISAHWYISGTYVTAMPRPQTIHDFGNFPDALFNVQYPAPGNVKLAEHIKDLLLPAQVGLDLNWGLDHGTWSVLSHVYPQADVPVIQLSLDATQPAAYHYDLATRLDPLRDEGVLILGSGNIVHNLTHYAWDKPDREPHVWSIEFDQQVRDLLLAGQHTPLIDYQSLGEAARLAVPTPEHYLPLIYVFALKRKNDSVSFPVNGFEGGSISMTAVKVGK